MAADVRPGVISNPEEYYSALSMVPGIVMALAMGRSKKYAPVKAAVYAYIITCSASITYHLHNYYYGFDPRFLRLDFFGQNIGMWTGMAVSPFGIPGAIALAPFSCLSLVLTNLKSAKEAFLAELTTAAGILVSVAYKPSLLYTWCVTFLVYMVRKFRKNPYSHSAFHMLLHVGMYQYYRGLV